MIRSVFTAGIALVLALPAQAQANAHANVEAVVGGPLTVAKTDVVVAAFARAFFEDDNAGMLAQLPDLIARAEAEGDMAIARTLTTFLDVLAGRDHRSWDALIEQFASFSDIGIVSRVYDELNRLAVALPVPTLAGETPGVGLPTAILAAQSRSQAPQVQPLEVGWDFGFLWPNSIDGVATIPALPEGAGINCLVRFVPTSGGTVDISVSMFTAQPARVALVLIDESGATMDFPPLALVPEAGFLATAEVGDPNWLAALGEADALLFVETTQQGATMRLLVQKGETGRTVFDQAFAAWGLTPAGAE